MRIAIVGAGISGNVVARLLCTDHDVHLFEEAPYAGGHSNTVDVSTPTGSYAVDTGFMVFNDRTYPNFCRLLQLLDVVSQESDMSFSVRSDTANVEYQGSSLNGLFAQRFNLARPKFLGMLRDVVRFNRQSVDWLNSPNDHTALGEFLDKGGYGQAFRRWYLQPMAAAIWSARPDKLMEFPARFLIGFFHNHGLLEVYNRPQWRTIPGGARSYVSKLLEPLKDKLRLNRSVRRVQRFADHVVVTADDDHAETFDCVVFASHADQTLRMLVDADKTERQILSSFPYQPNEAILHADVSIMPKRRRAWASWNYHLNEHEDQPATVTYDLTRLQSLPSPAPILLTLNASEQIDANKVYQRLTYSHPVFSHDSIIAQRRHSEINGHHRTYFCGAYWGYGFHEDGVKSALAVADQFGKSMDSWTVASTKAAFNTAASVR